MQPHAREDDRAGFRLTPRAPGGPGTTATQLWWRGRTLLRAARGETAAAVNATSLTYGTIIDALPCAFADDAADATCAITKHGVDIVVRNDVLALSAAFMLRSGHALPVGVLLEAEDANHPLWLLRARLAPPVPVAVPPEYSGCRVLATAAAAATDANSGMPWVVVYAPSTDRLALCQLAAAPPRLIEVAGLGLGPFHEHTSAVVPGNTWVARSLSGALTLCVHFPATQQLCYFALEGTPATDSGESSVSMALRVRFSCEAQDAVSLELFPRAAATETATETQQVCPTPQVRNGTMKMSRKFDYCSSYFYPRCLSCRQPYSSTSVLRRAALVALL